MKSLVRAAAVFALTASPVVAGAQPAAPTAEQIKAAADEFDAGRKAYNAGDYSLAAEHFEAADRHAPSPNAIELAIRSRQDAGQLPRAATLAALALTRDPNAPGLKALTAPILKQAGARLGRVDVHCSSPCDMVVGTKLVYGKASREKTVYVEPGTYTFRAGWSKGRNASHQVQVAQGVAVDVSFREPPLPTPGPTKSRVSGAPPSPETTSPPLAKPVQNQRKAANATGWSPVVFWVGAGLTAALGGATIWSGVDTQQNPGPDQVRQVCVNQGPSCPAYQDGRSRQLRTNILAAVTGGVGVATILVGVFATRWGGAPAADRARKSATWRDAGIEPWIAIQRGATLGAQGRF